jgi:PHP domain-containing protein
VPKVNPYLSLIRLKFEPHLHTLHSDGRDSISTMFRACKNLGYAAVALTDHNTQSGVAEARAVAAELGLLLIPGVEVTTFRGHAIVLGVSHVPEWRNLEERGMDALAGEVHAEGGVLSVAHAAHIGSPVCSGCAWEWPIEPSSVDYWEILTAARMLADVPVALWRQLLGAGAHVAPAGAGDVHAESAAASERAATYVYARERTAEAVMDGLRAKRVFASEGEPLEFWLENGRGDIALVGEHVSGDGWQPCSEPTSQVHDVTVGDGRCMYAELRDAQGKLQAISAPIWISTSH